MKVYTYWDFSATAPERQAEFFRIWERSWSRHGWEPRLLTSWNIKEKGNDEPDWLSAFIGVKGGFYSDIRVFNNGLKPFKPRLALCEDASGLLVWMDNVKNWRRRDWGWLPIGLCTQWLPGVNSASPTLYFSSVDLAHQSGICL